MAEIPLKKRNGAVRGWQIYALFLIFLLGIPGSLYWAIHSPDGIPSQKSDVLVQTDQIRQTAQPAVKTFQVMAPVGMLSRIIPVLPRHCLDWDAIPPHSIDNVEVYLDGKLYTGGYPNSKSVRVKSKLPTAIPVTFVQRPMPCGRQQG